jgi:tetratricopeptide (TPR) repeat protein
MRQLTSTILLLVGTQAAEGQAPTDLQQRAAQAWSAQQWAQAAEAYAALAGQSPNQALPHFRLAVALINLGRPGESASHLEQAERLGTPLPQVAFRMAQVRAAVGDKDGAFAQLKRATDAGLAKVPVSAESDPFLSRLTSDGRFAEFQSAVDRNARPCLHDPRHSDFDFWLGDWDVRPRGQPGAPASRNTITKIHDGCVVLESYSAPSYTGQSFNIYDRTRHQWNQTWVDKMGGLHVYWGEAREGNMYYEGEMPDPAAPTRRVKTRLTFFKIAADTVRQFSESTRDDGKTWTVNYDLIYTRRK